MTVNSWFNRCNNIMEDGRYIGLIKSVPTFIIRLYYELELPTNVAGPPLPRSFDYLTHHSLRSKNRRNVKFSKYDHFTKYNCQQNFKLRKRYGGNRTIRQQHGSWLFTFRAFVHYKEFYCPAVEFYGPIWHAI